MKISPPLPPLADVPNTADPLPPSSDTVELSPEAVVFPMACLPGAAGDMAVAIARVTTSQNEPLAAASVLSILSAAIGAGLEVSTGGERVGKANLYILAIAESGTGKGEAFRLAAAPYEIGEAEVIEAFDMNVRPRLVAEISVADLRAKKLCKDAAKESDPHARMLSLEEYRRAEEEKAELLAKLETAPRWKVGDVTKEALAIAMSGQPGEALASLSSEARGILSIVKGRYSKTGGDEDLYCSAYSGDSVSVDRVGRPRVDLRRPCLSVCWMIQPDSARASFAEASLTESGLLPRFLIFDTKAEPQERFETPLPIPPGIKNAWNDLIRSLLAAYRSQGGAPYTVTTTDEAKAILDDYERENVRRRRKDGDLPDLAPYVARWAENAWRVALVLHTARYQARAHHVPLTGTTADDAVTVMRWFADRQLEVLQSGRMEKLRNRLSALLAVLAEHASGISFRTLRRTHSFAEEEIILLQRMFPNRFVIGSVPPEGGIGRPSPSVFLHGGEQRTVQKSPSQSFPNQI